MRRGMVDTLQGFRRQLVLRLVVVGLVASLLAGVAAFLIETERLDETLVDQAALAGRVLADQVAKDRNAVEVEETLQRFLLQSTTLRRDYFVLAELYDPAARSQGEAMLPRYADIDGAIDRGGHHFPDAGQTWYTKAIVDGQPFLQVMVSLSDADGRPDGWFEGIYRLSPETLEAVRADVLRIVALAVAAAALTAAALYPLMMSLQGHVIDAAGDLLRANMDTLKVLGNAIAKRDSDTNAHNYRVTLYSVRIAEALGLDAAAIRSLIKGSFLHDVGKIAIPDAVLLKPGRLDEAEFSHMKTHVAHGLDIIAGSDWLSDAADVVGGHHEKVDGSGYPRGLAGTGVPLAARIFAVADVFDALTSERPYKKPFPVAKAVAILEDGRDRHFDGAILDTFLRILPQAHAEVSAAGEDGAEALTDGVIRTYFRV